MRLTLIDRIVELKLGESITATKNLSLSEGYLKDHFPLFPVMPGVLMLEAMYQTAAWLVRTTDDFAHSLVLLHEAKNVKYSDFVEPGQQLIVTAEFHKPSDDSLSWLKCQGTVDGKIAVRCRLVLKRYNLADSDESRRATDTHIIQRMREKLDLLYPAHAATTHNH